MRSNPGGNIAPENAVGRGEAVAQIWEILKTQSIYMNAERRIGKSTILGILDGDPQPGWVPVKRDLESIHSAEEFATAVYQDVGVYLSKRKRSARRMKKILESLAGTEIGGVLRLPGGDPIPWKTVLQNSIQDLNDSFQSGEDRLLFLWDEVPFMLDNITKRNGAPLAMEVLDSLRFLRQTYPGMRMILTGSIGLHHVLSDLRKSGYSNAPTNDMYAFEVGPLSESAGKDLALQLLKGERIASSNSELARGTCGTTG